MKKVLLCGHHPLSGLGNGNMMAALLHAIDKEKYQAACFAPDTRINEVAALNPLPIIPAGPHETECERLVNVVQTMNFDVIIMVGMDIWWYSRAFPALDKLRAVKKFKWISIFPYDAQDIRMDWVGLMKYPDVPCVYSKYGEMMLEKVLPNIRYFRPPLWNAEKFVPGESHRKTAFPTVRDDQFILGFVGKNQIRKDPMKLLKAFSEAVKVNRKLLLYLHCEMVSGQRYGVYNLQQYVEDLGLKTGMLVAKRSGVKYSVDEMVKLYNSFDCLINCSIQEGLSWTPLEAMLCGCPVIASDTTSQSELIRDVGELVPVTETAYVPSVTKAGESYIEGKSCSVEDIKDAILKVAASPGLRDAMSAKGIERGKLWLSGVSDINELLHDALKPKAVPKSKRLKKVLFIQHSSAGDVLMTTQCFKGLKERHPGMPLVYMTQKRFAGIVEGNPYLDEIIPWNDNLPIYSVVYNPHGEHILQGGFNNLDVTLHSMYPYFCKVEPDEIFIDPVEPDTELPEKYVVIHTTGGNKRYRTYTHMNAVIKDLELPTVQIGGADDMKCDVDIDLRGLLSWRESAWVMKNAEAAVAVDSFLTHLAGAVGTDAVALYGPAPPRVVGPRAQHGCNIINLKPDMLAVCKIMSHCWSTPPQCMSPCINTISPRQVRKSLNDILRANKLIGDVRKGGL